MADAAAVEDLAAQISLEAHTWLQKKRMIDAAKSCIPIPLKPHHLHPRIKWTAVFMTIANAYDVRDQVELLYELEDHLYREIVEPLNTALPARSPIATDSEYSRSQYERLRFEFTRPYIGGDHIPKQLHRYILQCATESAMLPMRYNIPSIAIVQSSGFGKSRLLRELAHYANTRDPHDAMRVLYTCVRPKHVTSSGYPQATAKLRDYLFPIADYEETANRRFQEEKQQENDLADRLFRLYDYAATDWDAVGLEWFELFENQDDASVCKRLLNHQVQGKHRSFDQVRTVVLAIDEARYLLEALSRDSINWFRLLRRSLQKATVMIRNAFGERASLFAVLVDTNSKVTNFVPPAQQDHSSRGKTNDDSILFPPFVLTQTMDIRLEAMMKGGVQNPASSREEASQRGSSSEEKTQRSHSKTAFFQGIVAREYRAAWPVFVAMGRPLWDRVKADDHSAGAEATEIIQLAADKILGGFSAAEPDSFRKESLFGVASALCRLGLRPSSWSPFASRAIAEFMIVLLHVNFTHDQLLVSYSSDPILTFGAARVWYQSASMSDVHSLLSTYILPQLSKLLRQDVMDTGEVGELVSRMLLLLVMDATGAVVAKHTDQLVPDRVAFQYAGEFVSVKTFLEVLHGHEDITVRDGFMNSVTDHQVVDMLKVLRPWKLGFSHFVHVSEQPTKTMLWAMLARRAAGIFPRNCKGVDLFIPMLKGEDVSMIVVQVKNVADYDKAFPYSASIGMRPSFVNKFKPSELSDVVRIYMSLRGRDATTRSQFYLVDEGIRHSPRLAAPSTQSYALCLHGLGPWTALREAPVNAEDKFLPVVSQGVATVLQRILEPWWDVIEVVKEDISRRTGRFGMKDDEILQIASRPLVTSLMTASEEDEPSTTGGIGEKHPRSSTFNSDQEEEKLESEAKKRTTGDEE